MRWIVGLSVSVVPALGARSNGAIKKVLEMMGNMKQQGKDEMHQEQLFFASFKTWCSDTETIKTKSIADAKMEIDVLQAAIETAAADVVDLDKSIEERVATIGKLTTEKNAAIKVREGEHAEFLKAKQDYEESIDAIQRATEIVKAEPKTVAQAEALAQVGRSKSMSQTQKDTVMALIQTEQTPEAAAYENSSGGIVEMFEQLESKFKTQLYETQEAEAKVKAAHVQLVENLDNMIANETKQKDYEASDRGGRQEDKGKAQEDKTNTEASLLADETFLADTQAECSTKAEEYAARQKLRTEELAVLDKAMEIIGGVPTEVGEKHISLIQMNRYISTTPAETASVEKVIAFLQEKGRKIDSRALELLAMRVMDSPFKKVIKMVEDLILKLKQEAQAEATKNGYCSTAMAANKITREEKQEAVDKLTAQIAELSESIAEMTNRIKENTEAIAVSDKTVAEATAQRAEESATNKKTIEEAKAASAAVASALSVLNEFYEGAAQATALTQRAPGDPGEAMTAKPETWDSSYQGMQGQTGGVLGLLQTIQDDFIRLETETDQDESTAADAHQKFLDDSATDKAVKETENSHLSAKKDRSESDLDSNQKDLEITQKELGAAKEVQQSLFEECDVNAVSHEERFEQRKVKRETEVQSLKEALAILNGM